MTRETLQERLRKLLTEMGRLGLDEPVEPGSSLLEAGVLDSIVMIELIGLLEETLGLQVADDEITPDNFDSLDAIAGFVAGKRSVTP